ncbi:hypothetical protein HHX47_DHR4000221 [Lentinula edodes]|nr:hypothetical protein HHX47_DHR4000221 [Lentinula edodes]
MDNEHSQSSKYVSAELEFEWMNYFIIIVMDLQEDKLESITRRTGLSLRRREVLLQLSVEHGPYVPGRDCVGAHILDKAHTLPKDSETCTSNKAVQLEVGQLLVERILHPD